MLPTPMQPICGRSFLSLLAKAAWLHEKYGTAALEAGVLAIEADASQEDVLKLKDLSTASVVMLYMGDDVNLRLRPILQKTLKPGSRIVSHRFGMGHWKPDRTETFDGEDGEEYTLHLWTIPAK